MSVNIPKVSDMPQESSTLGLTPEIPDRGGMRTQAVDHGAPIGTIPLRACLLYTSDAADERSSVDLGGRRIIKKKKWCANSDTLA